MKEFAKRFTKGMDLKNEIIKTCLHNGFDTAIVLCATGCVDGIKIRLAGATDYLKKDDDFEIVSLNGTISKGQAHLHIALADKTGLVYGGHLCEGTYVNTTVELVLGILEEYDSYRTKDDSTGYDEIVFNKKA